MKQKTTDITLAAYLKTKGYTLVEVTITGRQGTFVFEGVDADEVNQFFIGNAQVEPTAFHNAVRQLTTACKRIGSNE